MAILEELSSSDDVCSHGGGITSEDRCQQTLRCQNSIAGYTLHWETMEYGTMIGNPRNVHDHPKDVAEADDFLKQHVYFPSRRYVGSKSSASLSNSNCLLYSALQEMRKARYVSVIADKVTLRKT